MVKKYGVEGYQIFLFFRGIGGQVKNGLAAKRAILAIAFEVFSASAMLDDDAL